MLLLQLSLSTQCSFSSYVCVTCQVPEKDLGFHSPLKDHKREFLREARCSPLAQVLREVNGV